MPAIVFAVNWGATALPLLFVLATTAVKPPVNVPLAPLPGAVNVTARPPTGLPKESTTVARIASGKDVATVVLEGVPAVAVMVAGFPALLVRLKLAGVATPATLAVTK